jgi:hypothetical protein
VHTKALRVAAETLVRRARRDILDCIQTFDETTRNLDSFAVGTPQVTVRGFGFWTKSSSGVSFEAGLILALNVCR